MKHLPDRDAPFFSIPRYVPEHESQNANKVVPRGKKTECRVW